MRQRREKKMDAFSCITNALPSLLISSVSTVIGRILRTNGEKFFISIFFWLRALSLTLKISITYDPEYQSKLWKLDQDVISQFSDKHQTHCTKRMAQYA